MPANSPARYAVLLRGINVGARNKLPMKDLRRVLGDLGLGDPETYLQSGQAFVTTDLAAARLERAVHDGIDEALGLTIDVQVRSHAQLAAVVEGNPFADQADADPKRVTAVFVDGAPDVSRLDLDLFAPDELVVGDGVLYLHTPEGMGRSKLGAYDWRRSGVRATARNWRTVLALLDRTAP